MTNFKDRPIVKLWRDKKAVRYLQKLAKTEPLFSSGFLGSTPYNSFPKIINFNKQAVADAIIQALPQLTAKEVELAELYMQMPPRLIAEKLGVKRSVLYDRLRALRAKALALSAAQKDDLLLAREFTPIEERLDCPPEAVAVRTVRLTLGENTKHVYQIERDGECIWVDQDGLMLTADVAELLDNLEEDQSAFEFLDVESI